MGALEKRFWVVDTRVPANPPKKAHVSNELQAPESQSRLINNAAQIEFFGGGHWQQVVSPDGVATHVTRLWPMKVLLSPTAAAAMARAGSSPTIRGRSTASDPA